MLITPEYLELQRELHARGSYGVSAGRWARDVHGVALRYSCKSVIDYGSGPGLLAQGLPLDKPYSVIEYDPAIPEKATLPGEAADLVYCGDVLEHIEPACLHDVLDHIAGLTLKAVFLVIATRPAKKHLADGRNAHLIVKSVEWWLPILLYRWKMSVSAANSGEFQFLGTPK